MTRLAAAGVPARTIMELAGHTRLATSLRYMHALSGSGERAVAALEAFDQQEQSKSEVPPPIANSAS